MSALDAELFVCMESDAARCELDPTGDGWAHHRCNHDDPHNGPHECVCGHTWTNPEEN